MVLGLSQIGMDFDILQQSATLKQIYSILNSADPASLSQQEVKQREEFRFSAFQNRKTYLFSHHFSFFPYPKFIKLFQQQPINMGSSPSYESQGNNPTLSVRHSRLPSENRKAGPRTLKKRSKEPEMEEINPENEVDVPLQYEHKDQEILDPFMPFQKENKSQKDPNQSVKNTPMANYEELAKANLPKKAPVEEEPAEEEHQEAQNMKSPSRNGNRHERYHYPIKNKGEPTQRHSVHEQEYVPEVHEQSRGRHYVKDSNHNDHSHEHPDHINNSLTIKKQHRKSEEIDYHQFDSAHIRHKAIQEVHQQEHAIHPVKPKQPIYQHEKLYPKILKNFHQDPHALHADQHRNNSNNRHFQHQHNLEEDIYEQPHHINLYKRHRIPTHNRGQEHEDPVEEEAEPKSHPNFKQVHRDEKQLQRSLEVRGSHHEETAELKNSLNVRTKAHVNSIDGEDIKKRKESTSPQDEIINEVPPHANFRKRKQSIPHPQEIDKAQLNKAKSKLQELQSKSIAEINKDNEFNVTQYNVDPLELVTCGEGCGRKFQADRIQKHEAVCRKVFQQRRREFNAQDQRIISKEQKKLLKKGGHDKAQEDHKKKGKIPKWKAQSIALRAHIKMGMDQNYVPDDEQAEMLSQQHHIDIVNCPYCGRNFNKNSAKTHVPFCKTQYEKQIQRQRFEKPIKRRV